jgi:phosphoserine phosphatase
MAPGGGPAALHLVLQSPHLTPAAVAAFREATGATRVTLRDDGRQARLAGLPGAVPPRDVLQALGQAWRCDATLVPEGLRLQDFRVLAMDMDSTLITVECIDEIAALAGRGAAVRAITEAAMRGELPDFSSSLVRRVALLAGTPQQVLEQVWQQRVRLSEGAAALVAACRAAGLRTLLVSGGFTYYTDRLMAQLGIDEARANELQVRAGVLTGTATGPGGGPIVDALGKARAVEECCARVGCAPADAIVVGDGANDLAMMALAGLSVAYRAKPVVRQAARMELNWSGLDAIATLFDR